MLNLLLRHDLVPGDSLHTEALPLGPVEAAPEAFSLFGEGLSAEERFQWLAARRAYEAAANRGGPGFGEPVEALKRTARLRAGGTLGASQ